MIETGPKIASITIIPVNGEVLMSVLTNKDGCDADVCAEAVCELAERHVEELSEIFHTMKAENN